MTRFILQIIAFITMTLDHFGMLIFYDTKVLYEVLRSIGRLAFPLFAFLLGEGFRKTRNLKKYFLRIFILGLIIEIGAFIAQFIFGDVGHVSMNIYMTLSFGLLIAGLLKSKKIIYKFLSIIPILIVLLVEFKFQNVVIFKKTLGLTFEYGIFGIMLVLSFTLFKKPIYQIISFVVVTLFLGTPEIFSLKLGLNKYLFANESEHFGLLIIPFILLYNGEMGFKLPKWFTYSYYPVHLAIIYVISLYL